MLARLRHLRRYTAQGQLRNVRITQQLLAERIGCSRTLVANIENKRQSLSVLMLYQICEALDVDVTDVLPTLPQVRDSLDAPEVDAQPEIQWAGQRYDIKPGEEALLEEVMKVKRKGDAHDR